MKVGESKELLDLGNAREISFYILCGCGGDERNVPKWYTAGEGGGLKARIKRDSERRERKEKNSKQKFDVSRWIRRLT